jgi:hypothetical protein
MSSSDYRSVRVQTVLIWNESMLHTPLIIFSYWFFFLSRPHLGSWFQDRGASCMSRVCFIRSDFVLFLLLFLLVWRNWQNKMIFLLKFFDRISCLVSLKIMIHRMLPFHLGGIRLHQLFATFFFFLHEIVSVHSNRVSMAPATPIDLNEIRHAVTWKRVV